MQSDCDFLGNGFSFFPVSESYFHIRSHSFICVLLFFNHTQFLHRLRVNPLKLNMTLCFNMHFFGTQLKMFIPLSFEISNVRTDGVDSIKMRFPFGGSTLPRTLLPFVVGRSAARGVGLRAERQRRCRGFRLEGQDLRRLGRSGERLLPKFILTPS